MTSLPAMMKQWQQANGRQAFRTVAFGASNTEIGWHSQGHHGWPCWLSCAIRATVGRRAWMLNAGIGGDTAAGLRARVDEDVLTIQPHFVIITIGGNDFFQRRPLEQFEDDLRSLHATLRGAGAVVAFQTYYAFLPEAGEGLGDYMNAVRNVAAASGAGLIDQYAWFLRLRDHDLPRYREIMLDGAHLKPAGNALFGTMAARVCGAYDPVYPDEMKRPVAERLAILDQLGAPKRNE
jgi:lysophospholipase L1-like esterase